MRKYNDKLYFSLFVCHISDHGTDVLHCNIDGLVLRVVWFHKAMLAQQLTITQVSICIENLKEGEMQF